MSFNLTLNVVALTFADGPSGDVPRPSGVYAPGGAGSQLGDGEDSVCLLYLFPYNLFSIPILSAYLQTTSPFDSLLAA